MSGVEGYITSRHHLMGGTIQYALTPKSDDGLRFPDPLVVDFQQLEQLDAGISDRTIPVPPTDIQLGDLVQDHVSRYSGTVVERVDFMNGCIYFVFWPRRTLLNRLLGAVSTDRLHLVHTRLVKLPRRQRLHWQFRPEQPAAVEEEEAEPVTEAKPKKGRTGGPSRRLTRDNFR